MDKEKLLLLSSAIKDIQLLHLLTLHCCQGENVQLKGDNV